MEKEFFSFPSSSFLPSESGLSVTAKIVLQVFLLMFIGILGKNFNRDSEHPKSGVTLFARLTRSINLKQWRMGSLLWLFLKDGRWGYSQREVADYLRLTYFALSRIMKGREKSTNKTVLRVSWLNGHYSENLPSPLFSKEGYYSSLWQREVRRDFIKQCFHYSETVNNREKGMRGNGEVEPRHLRNGNFYCSESSSLCSNWICL